MSVRIKRSSLSALVFLLTATPALAADGPITVFVAKKIITMDPGWPEATAVAVRDGKILSVGSLDDLQPWLKSAPYKIDRTFEAKILMPGFVEPHGHPLIGGLILNLPMITYQPTLLPYGPEFPGAKTAEKAMALMKKYVAQAKNPSEPVVIWGWDVVAMGGRHLEKTTLDKISNTQPIIVWDASEHFAYANTAAMNRAGIKDVATHNGQFLGTTELKSIMQSELASLLAPDKAIPEIRSVLDLSARNGITTQSELLFGGTGNSALEEKLYDEVFNKDPNVRTRLVAVADGTEAMRSKNDGAVEYVRSLARKSTDTLIFKGVKAFTDDSFLGLGMAIENPGYIDGHTGIYIIKPGDALRDALMPWWKAGMQIHVHSNGNAGNQATLDALAALQGAYPRFDHRFSIEHFGIATPEMARRLKALGGVASLNPYYVYTRGELGAPSFGTDRAYTAVRLKTLLDAGNTVSLHSDTPVGPPRPLEWIWIAVNRFGLSGKVLAPAERVSVVQAMKMVTIDAAYTLGVEDKIGSIQAGKFADFTVLEQDPTAIPKKKIKDIKVWGTVVGGRVIPASGIRH
ncbi:amidohydrolase [Bradyrhizobium sp.]|uniref:amidohydrolase n=1 Tax=Bradyrhizobium sp. TaxID=376 RepID=UPI003C7234C7